MREIECGGCEYIGRCEDDPQKPDYCSKGTLWNDRIGDLHDRALRQSQSKLTRTETLYEVSDWLMNRYRLGWIAHNEIPCPKPEVFELMFYKSDIDSLYNGVVPKR